MVVHRKLNVPAEPCNQPSSLAGERIPLGRGAYGPYVLRELGNLLDVTRESVADENTVWRL